MSSEETFRESAAGTATVHETTAEEFAETLESAIEKPAVGTPLPFEGVSLDESPVETEFSPEELQSAETGVTPARVGIGEYGTVTLPSDGAGSELVSLYTPRHVAVLAASAIEPDMKAAYERLSEEFAGGADSQVLATGPSATADMGTLIEGVHGPHEVHILVLEDR
ncbi:lactate utilization protein C [Halovenus sp. WSH3]|uniref:Lactate utilization protein C n=1 Tax=Halovenus carboxidivorans TaxID=2692199 RepID=A0A6B0T8R7_9EURY|nr:LUD domain-containing protein [Halovenus carboxidivorans]MXR51732.1 lactate utilization protein C [Halovenus carboxidivorans]